MEQPLISILMPVKNAASFLDQCLDSIIHQSYTNWELLVVDDGSIDASCDIVGKYEDMDDRIHLLYNDSEGIIPALSKAFEHSVGHYISRMDADDVMPTKKLENLLTALIDEEKSRVEKIVVTGKVRYFSDKKVSEGYRRYEKWLNEVVDEEAFKPNVYRECVVASPNWMVHRSCFERDIPFDSLIYPEDYDLVFQWLKAGYKFKGLSAVTHLWREHPDRTSRNNENYQQPAFFRLKTERFIEHHPDQIQGVQLIGKGPKGKLIARILEEHQIDFEWFDLNPAVKQRSVLDLENKLSILSNWPLDERIQEDIQRFLKRKGLKFGKDVWLF